MDKFLLNSQDKKDKTVNFDEQIKIENFSSRALIEIRSGTMKIESISIKNKSNQQLASSKLVNLENSTIINKLFTRPDVFNVQELSEVKIESKYFIKIF